MNYAAVKFEVVRLIVKEMILEENTLFDPNGVKVTGKVAQNPLHHVTNAAAAANFEVATSKV